MIKRIVRIIEGNVSQKGIVLGIKKFVEQCGTKIKVDGDQEINLVLKNGAGILVANHHTETDVLAILAAVKKRKDVYIIINSSIRGLVSKLDKHLIPVYVNNRIFTGIEGKLKLKFLSCFTNIEVLTREEEIIKNRKSIETAIKKINKGGLVIIFPDGGNEKLGWFNGVGHLIHGIKNENNSFFIRAYIKGTTDFDFLRLIPGVGRIMPKFLVTFDKPIEINKVKMVDAKVTTKYLERQYLEWVSSFNPWSYNFLINKHGVTKTEKMILLINSGLIGVKSMFLGSKSRN